MKNTNKRRSGVKIMAQLIGLVRPLLHIMLAAIVLGTAGYLCAIFLTILAGKAILGELPVTKAFILLVVIAVLRGVLHYAEQYCNHFIAFRLLAIIRHKVRGEIAILASVLGLTHIVYYGHSLGKRAGRTGGMMSGTERVTLVIAFLIIFLLVPLTVTSFKWVRRKMNGKRWKKLQKWSYLFYGLLYLHVAVVAYPKAISGNTRSLADLCCYTAVFGIYAVLRIEKYLERKKKQAYYPAVWSLLVIMLTTGAFALNLCTAKNAQAKEKIKYISESETIVNNNEHASEKEISGYADGTWEGEGMGLNGPVRVEVIVENAMITDVKILERTDDDPYFTDARLELVPEILKQQSADVDVVSGATFSSEGILEAVEEALKHAGRP